MRLAVLADVHGNLPACRRSSRMSTGRAARRSEDALDQRWRDEFAAWPDPGARPRSLLPRLTAL